MKVIVAGGSGCGTTHVYRIACGLLSAAGYRHEHRGASQQVMDAEQLLQQPGHAVIKTHDAIVPSAFSHCIFLCRRDPLDAAASYLRRVPDVDILADIRARMRLEAGYHGRRDVILIDYEEFHGDSRAKVRRVAHALGIGPARAIVTHVALKTGVQQTKAFADRLAEADADSELRPGHIGPLRGAPGTGERLPPELKTAIGRIYARL